MAKSTTPLLAPKPPTAKSESGTSTSSKRKRGAEPKFYAVRIGVTPGIYHNWNDCKAQITGFKNAAHKSFHSLTDAEAFMRGERPSSHSPTASASPPKYYAVQSGRVPGVYTDWDSALKQITGWMKPRHKAFPTRAEAEAFVRQGTSNGEAVPNVTVDPDQHALSIVKDALDADKDAVSQKKKRPKTSNDAPDPTTHYADTANDSFFDQYEPGTAPLPPDAEDGFDRRVVLNPKSGKIERKTPEQLRAVKRQPTGDFSGPIKIWTDGSSRGNGFAGAVAGVGVFFGPGDDRNLSERLAGPRQTNQRAELTAIRRAVELTPCDRDVVIHTDSSYAINCVTVWCAGWRRNGWLTAAKKPVENRDLVEAVVLRVEERRRAGAGTEFVWVKGHANDPGNVAADRLAVQGAMGTAYAP